jgi:hypothetical protein
VASRRKGLNGLFQAAQARARGHRNIDTFVTMIDLIAPPLGDIMKSNQNVEEPNFTGWARRRPTCRAAVTALLNETKGRSAPPNGSG